MIEQPGIVTAVREGEARVDAAAGAGGCAVCGAGGGCGTASLARFFGRRQRSLWVRNDVHAAVGDRVVIGLDEAALQRAALTAYAWPLVGLLAGSLLGDLVIAPGTGELAVVIAGLTGLFAGIVVARRSAARAAADRRTQPRVLHREPAPTVSLGSMRGGTQ
ncbi:MAG: SoxR reducing system RseC family protein [Gammaproteobacteria bacterium]